MSDTHEWIRRARVFLMDNYHPPFWPDLEFDAEKLVDVAQRYHVNAIRFGSAGKWAVFPNDFWPPHPQLGDRDLIHEILDAAHPRGIKVITYIPTGHIIPDENIMVHHPEWLYRPAPNADPPLHLHHGGGLHWAPCLNTPYRDAYLGFVEQLITDHAIDGIYTDSGVPYHSHSNFQSSLCYCDYCLEKFEKQFGCPMPYAADPHTLPQAEKEMLEAWSLSVGRMMADVVIECDFGRVACVICFDIYFDEARRRVAETRPDLVLFSSMVHGGLLQRSWAYDCRAHFVAALHIMRPSAIIAPTGELIATTTNYLDHVTASINLDCELYHLDHNRPRIEAARAKYGRQLAFCDPGYLGAVLLSSESDERTMTDIADEFELESLDDYLHRSLVHQRRVL